MSVIRKGLVKACAANGFDDRAAGYAKAEKAAARIAEVLGNRPFLLGDEPDVADCAVWANTMQNAYTRSANPARAAVRSHDNIMSYIDRMSKRAKLQLPALPS